MNHKKEGHQCLSWIIYGSTGIPFRQTEGLIKSFIIKNKNTKVDAIKWQKRREFLKIHVDVKFKQITGLEITDDKSHDSKCFTSLVEQSKQFCNVTKILAWWCIWCQRWFCIFVPWRYYCRNQDKKEFISKHWLLSKKKSCFGSIIQFHIVEEQCKLYEDRWIVESVSSTFKRMFGEYRTRGKIWFMS